MVRECLIANVKPLICIYLMAEQALLGFVKADLLLESRFDQDSLLTFGDSVVDDQIIHIRNGRDLKDPAFIAFDLIAGAESHPGKGSPLLRICSIGAADGKVNGDLPAGDGEYLTHPQFRLSIADPALTQAELRQTSTLEQMSDMEG
jgi:hypothetical protein|tara:strand:- start:24282 stop:24722 length:441 start_codon:yes stop_codon:yes gene_type:complete